MTDELKKAINAVGGVVEETPDTTPEVKANPPDCLHCVWGRVVDEYGRRKTVYCPRSGCEFMGKGKRDER